MHYHDFCYMRQGKQLAFLNESDHFLLKAINKKGKNHDKALLMLHGFASTPAVFRHFIPQLTNYDAISCPVLEGHAQSIEAFSLSSAQGWRFTAQKGCEELAKNYRQLDILGLSLGGLLAFELSQQMQVHHLFLLAPAFALKMPVSAVLKLASLLQYLGFYQVRNQGGNIISPTQAEITYRTLPIKAIIEMLTLTHNFEWKPPSCPVDLFLGAQDKVIDTVKVAQLFASLPNTTLHWLKNSAHVLPLDNEALDIIQCINTPVLVNRFSNFY